MCQQWLTCRIASVTVLIWNCQHHEPMQGCVIGESTPGRSHLITKGLPCQYLPQEQPKAKDISSFSACRPNILSWSQMLHHPWTQRFQHDFQAVGHAFQHGHF